MGIALEAEVILQRISVDGSYRLVKPVCSYFHGYKKTGNWLVMKFQITDISILGIKHK